MSKLLKKKEKNFYLKRKCVNIMADDKKKSFCRRQTNDIFAFQTSRKHSLLFYVKKSSHTFLLF